MIEVELKFKVDNPEEFVRRLKKLGAKKVDDGLEENIKFTDSAGRIEKNDELLRLRSYAGRADITHKRMMPSTKFKQREEVVVNIDSFGKGRALLERLGFRAKGRYEKKRQTWELGDVGITLDTMPHMGNFMEIEGTEDGIKQTAEKLGLHMKDGITKDYGMLFGEYCRKTGSKLELVFPEGEK